VTPKFRTSRSSARIRAANVRGSSTSTAKATESPRIATRGTPGRFSDGNSGPRKPAPLISTVTPSFTVEAPGRHS